MKKGILFFLFTLLIIGPGSGEIINKSVGTYSISGIFPTDITTENFEVNASLKLLEINTESELYNYSILENFINFEISILEAGLTITTVNQYQIMMNNNLTLFDDPQPEYYINKTSISEVVTFKLNLIGTYTLRIKANIETMVLAGLGVTFYQTFIFKDYSVNFNSHNTEIKTTTETNNETNTTLEETSNIDTTPFPILISILPIIFIYIIKKNEIKY